MNAWLKYIGEGHEPCLPLTSKHRGSLVIADRSNSSLLSPS